MGRVKKGSRTLSRADQRLASIKSINSKLDLGCGFSVAAYEAKVLLARKLLGEYNTSLSKTDAAANAFQQVEKELAEMSEAMLLGVGMKYGKRSTEYEMAGGKRRGEKRRASKKVVASAPDEVNGSPQAVNESPDMFTA